MSLLRMDKAYNWTPEMFSISGSFVVPANSTTANQQIFPALLTVGSIGTPQLTPTETIAPLSARCNIFCSPNGSVAGAATNIAALPRGQAPGNQTAGSEYLIDISAFNADIISAQVTYCPAARGGSTFDAFVSAVDNVNKLVYVQVVNGTTGAAAPATTGAQITFQVDLKDTYTA